MKKMWMLLPMISVLAACGGNGQQAACDPNVSQCGQGGQVVQQSNGHPIIAAGLGAAGGALVMHHYMNKKMQQQTYGYHNGYGYNQPMVVHHYYPSSYGHTTVVHHYGNGYGGSRVVHVYHH